MKLMIAIPTYDYMHFQFVECLTKLIRRLDSDGIDFEVVYQGGTLVYVGRDRLAKMAIDKGFTHILWLDSDMIFNDDLLENLMDCGKPFVTGIAHGRRAPHMSCLFNQIWPSVDRWEGHNYPHEPFKVAGCGFACVLMETKVAEIVYNRNGTAFFPMRELGEDLAFCKRATEAKIEIWVEPRVWLGHIGHLTVYPDYEEVYKNSIQGFNEVNKNA